MRSTFYGLMAAVLLSSCVGPDTAFLPDTIAKAREQKMLIHVYRPSEKEVQIGGQSYLLEDSFTTFKQVSTKDVRPNTNFFAFVVKLKDRETEEDETRSKIDLGRLVRYNGKGIGISDSHPAVVFDDVSGRERLDSIQIGFIDASGNEKVVVYSKVD